MRLARSFRANNQRRCELIDKRHSDGPLTAAENAELQQLQQWCAAWVNEHRPWNTEYLEQLEQLEQQKGIL